MKLTGFVLVVALGSVLVGCGDGQERTMDPRVQGRLVADVETVKAAANSQDRRAAEGALAALHRSVASAQAQGQLDPATVGTILTATERVAEDVRTIPLPAPEPPVTITVPTPAPDADEQDKRQDREEEREKKREEQREKAEDKQEHGEGPG